MSVFGRDSLPGCRHGRSASGEHDLDTREGRQALVAQTIRNLRLFGWVANTTGAVVAFIAIGFLIPIFLDPSERTDLAVKNAPLVALVVLLGGLEMTWVMNRVYRAALPWIADGREPTEREHRLTLKIPAITALLSAAGWAVGGLVLAALNLDHSWGFAGVVLGVTWLGGETTAALIYLSSERTARNITALALAVREPDRSVAPGIRARLLFAWSLGTGVPIIGVLVVGLVGATKAGVETEYVAAACVFLAGLAMVVGMLTTMISAKAIADPVTKVRDALERVRRGDLGVEVPIDDSSELGLLQSGFNRMAEGLRERERMRDIFGRQVGHDVARAALRGGTRLGGEEREVGALFIDLVGSTSMALAMPPTEVVRLLNRFFRVVVDVVEEEGGLVNKFEGDAALCVFGAPVASNDPAGEALRAARRLCRELERAVPEIGFGIGVSAGRAVAGNVGSEQRFEYTVIGDPVNEASRLCDLAKERDERVIASEAALSRARNGELEEWAVGERAVLRGRLEATGLALPRA